MQKTYWWSRTSCRKFWWLDNIGSRNSWIRLWISKTIIDMQSWCKTWLPNGSSRIRVEQKLLRKRKGACKSSWNLPGNQKSFAVTTPWNFVRLVKIFRGIIVRQPRTVQKQMRMLKEQYAELRKGCVRYCCSQVWMKIGGRIPWNVIACCEILKIACLTGRHRTTFWWTIWGTDHSIWFFGRMSSNIPKRSVTNLSIWKERAPWNLPAPCIVRGENLERRHAGRGSLGAGRDGPIRNPCWKTQCKRGDIA